MSTISTNASFGNNPINKVTIQGVENRFNAIWTQIGFPGNLMPGMITLNGYTFDKTTGTIIDYNPTFGLNPVIPSTIDGVTVRIIGYEAFRNKGLTGLTIPTTIHTIGEGAFRNNQLQSVVIPDNITTMGSSAFAYNRGVTSVSIGAGIREIESFTFDANALTSLTIPNNVERIRAYAFRSNNIQQLSLGTGTRIIDTYAFQNNQLTEIIIPAQVSTISTNASFENNPINKVTIQGVENRFNAIWTQIGFPGNQMPGVTN